MKHHEQFSDNFVSVPSLNAIALKNAVLCADCDVVTDSPHDKCLVCGSRSLFNIAKILGGNLPDERTRLNSEKTSVPDITELIIPFPSERRVPARLVS